MAKEIGIQHGATGKTLYMLIRQNDQKIFNGTVFETYVTANLGTYDVPADGEQGTTSAFYEFTFPGAITAGVFLVSIHEQAGGSPAEGDSLVGILSFHWNGSAEVVPLDFANDKVDLVSVDGVAFNGLMEALLSFFAGEHDVVDLGGGSKRLDCKKQDGTTVKLRLTFDQNGQWTATVIV